MATALRDAGVRLAGDAVNRLWLAEGHAERVDGAETGVAAQEIHRAANEAHCEANEVLALCRVLQEQSLVSERLRSELAARDSEAKFLWTEATPEFAHEHAAAIFVSYEGDCLC